MNGLFLRILNMSLTASVICVAVLVLRAALRGRLPRWSFYCVWALVLARLLLPFSLPSGASAFNAIPAARPADGQRATITFVEESGAAVSFPTLQTKPPDTGAARPVVAPAPVEITTILASIWLCGVALLLAYSGGCYAYTMHRLRSARRLEHTPEIDALFRKAGVAPARVKLYVSDLFDSPVVCGLFRPRLILSGLVTRDDLRHVVAHELTHVRRRDNLWKALATLALYLHWFNPLLWYCYRGYVTDMEASCDEAVVRRNQCDRRAYATSLLNMAVKSQSAFAGGFLAFGECALKERVRSIMNVKKYAVIVSIVCVAMIAGLAVVFLTNPQVPPPAGDETDTFLPALTESAPSPASSAASSAPDTASASEQSASSDPASVPSSVSSVPAATPPKEAAAAEPLPLVVPWDENPPAFQVDYDAVDYFNLIDRQNHTYCAVTEPAGVAELVNLLNAFQAVPNTTDVPDESKLRLLQLRYKDGTKREYWMHNNLIVADNAAYRMSDALRHLYNEVIGVMDANDNAMGAEWLGFMNPYRITEMTFPQSSPKVYTATATDEQRDAILDVAAKLKALRVDPYYTETTARQAMPDPFRAGETICARLNFENGKEGYTIYVYDDGTITIDVDSISYLLTYDTDSNETFQDLKKTLENYAK